MKANGALILVFVVLILFAILLRRASDRDVEGPAGCSRLIPANEECFFF